MKTSQSSSPPPAYTEVTEQKRLNEARERGIPWKNWGPYLSERQWGTVREDYSHNGDAWKYFSHDQSRSRAYRWGEDRSGRDPRLSHGAPLRQNRPTVIDSYLEAGVRFRQND